LAGDGFMPRWHTVGWLRSGHSEGGVGGCLWNATMTEGWFAPLRDDWPHELWRAASPELIGPCWWKFPGVPNEGLMGHIGAGMGTEGHGELGAGGGTALHGLPPMRPMLADAVLGGIY
jgi:hypothetical protein